MKLWMALKVFSQLIRPTKIRISHQLTPPNCQPNKGQFPKVGGAFALGDYATGELRPIAGEAIRAYGPNHDLPQMAR
jgi:hypothetical protein